MTRGKKIAFALELILLASAVSSSAQAVTVLHSFSGTDGAAPWAPPVFDKAGNLYGTTSGGNGTAFRLSKDGTFTTLYRFLGGTDGAVPMGSLVLDAAGNLYGTTADGGGTCGSFDCGIVFKISASGTESVLHVFAGGNDGYGPEGGLVADASGNLYGTTNLGGGTACGGIGCGTVFKLAPDGTESILHAFSDGNDGGVPGCSLLLDKNGNLYGTTQVGGNSNKGSVFEVSHDGAEKVLYSFKGGDDGAQPIAGVVMDSSGNIYGTTINEGPYGGGTVFKLAPDGTETVLHSFSGGQDGYAPYGTLIVDAVGEMYGVTEGGGHRKGVVFKISSSGDEQILYAFGHHGSDGSFPLFGLTARRNSLYGTTFYGGPSNAGVIYRLKK